MNFNISEITRCAGNGHYHCTVSVNGGPSRTITVLQADLQLDPEDLETAFLNRVRSAVKEASATTFAQARTAVIGKDFKI